MLMALPVLPLLASTMVSPGRSKPSCSARSIMYLAIRSLTDPDGLRYSSLTQIPSTWTNGVPPIASKTVLRSCRWSPRGGERSPLLVVTCVTSISGQLLRTPNTDHYPAEALVNTCVRPLVSHARHLVTSEPCGCRHAHRFASDPHPRQLPGW